MQLIDSHCHLNRLDLTAFNHDLGQALNLARTVGVSPFLCVCVEPDEIAPLYHIAETYPDVFISVGVHPDYELAIEMDFSSLKQAATHPRCIALGETGLDYYRVESESFRDIQRTRFETHIAVALALKKPLIIHTRAASEDTLAVMRLAGADGIGGVMHCFTESYEVAKAAMDLNFYISLSGIVTFKNAAVVHDLAKRVPLDRLLIETDAPYLAPVPFRGKSNHPALVTHVAEAIAVLRGVSVETIAEATTANFYRCFKIEE